MGYLGRFSKLFSQFSHIKEFLPFETSDTVVVDHLFLMEASLSFGVVEDEGVGTSLDWKIY